MVLFILIVIVFSAKLGFQFQIKSTSISLSWSGWTVTWNYSICLCILSRYRIQQCFYKLEIKSFMHWERRYILQYISDPYLNSTRVEVDFPNILAVFLIQSVSPRPLSISSFIQAYVFLAVGWGRVIQLLVSPLFYPFPYKYLLINAKFPKTCALIKESTSPH